MMPRQIHGGRLLKRNENGWKIDTSGVPHSGLENGDTQPTIQVGFMEASIYLEWQTEGSLHTRRLWGGLLEEGDPGVVRLGSIARVDSPFFKSPQNQPLKQKGPRNKGLLYRRT